MLPFEDRYTRQRQVREVGSRGQERLLGLELRVVPGSSGDVEALYASRAGLRVTRETAEATPAFPHAHAFEHGAARAFAASAHRALQAIRSGLGIVPRDTSTTDESRT